ncbi:MAG: NAD-binding protein [Anaerolineales bacterium]|nr:NAD-binding protein [Anaerolineales bacterium]
MRAEQLAEALPNALVLHGDGTDFELLETEGLAEMHSFVAVTGDDENNIIAALLARQHAVPRPIVLVNRGRLSADPADHWAGSGDQQADAHGECGPAIYPASAGGCHCQHARHRRANDRIYRRQRVTHHPACTEGHALSGQRHRRGSPA